MGILHERLRTDFVSVPNSASIEEAINLIRKRKSELGDSFLYVYVVDAEGKLEGVLQLRDLLLTDPCMSVQNIMKTKPVFLKITSQEKEIESVFKQYPFLALPVVDESEKLAGVITAREVTDIVQIESNRMLHRFAGISGGEEIEGQSIFKIISRRLPWLLLSMVSGLMCAYILGIFIEEIESMIALVLFIPIVLGVAGGVGVQSSVIAARGISEGRFKLSEIGRILIKEIAIGCLIGLISCLVITLIAFFWQKSLLLGIALGVSVIASVVVSGLTGILLPFIFRVLRINPAFGSGIFVLVICDILVMIVYFKLSFLIINPPL